MIVGNFEIRLDALAHQVIARGIVRIRIETVHLEHASRQDIHYIISFKLDDVHLRFLFQRHIIIDQLAKGSQLFSCRADDRKAADRPLPQSRSVFP